VFQTNSYAAPGHVLPNATARKRCPPWPAAPFLNAKIGSRQNDEISHLAGIALNDGASRFKIRAGSKNRR
jgi:hypothetical protein